MLFDPLKTELPHQPPNPHHIKPLTVFQLRMLSCKVFNRTDAIEPQPSLRLSIVKINKNARNTHKPIDLCTHNKIEPTLLTSIDQLLDNPFLFFHWCICRDHHGIRTRTSRKLIPCFFVVSMSQNISSQFIESHSLKVRFRQLHTSISQQDRS
jgi:hypothetical protein